MIIDSDAELLKLEFSVSYAFNATYDAIFSGKAPLYVSQLYAVLRSDELGCSEVELLLDFETETMTRAKSLFQPEQTEVFDRHLKAFLCELKTDAQLLAFDVSFLEQIAYFPGTEARGRQHLLISAEKESAKLIKTDRRVGLEFDTSTEVFHGFFTFDFDIAEVRVCPSAVREVASKLEVVLKALGPKITSDEIRTQFEDLLFHHRVSRRLNRWPVPEEALKAIRATTSDPRTIDWPTTSTAPCLL